MALEVKLEVFEGPLDLLLHLIDKNKVDIYDIPIVEITNQYLEYIQEMEKQDMNIMSEFLVMAATLINIKCKMLLPKEINEDGEEEDPRAELVQKLLEYKMYKFMSYELKDKQMDADRVLYKEATLPEEVKDYKQPVDYENLVADVTLSKMKEIFNSMIIRQENKIDPVRSKFGKIEKDEVNMDEKFAYVRNMIRNNKEISFCELLKEQKSKMDVIVTFLVILELMKMGDIKADQDCMFDDIKIFECERETEDGTFETEINY